ncbi:nucleotide-binding alpha-beta plait domain-containing protein [Artemisia annua]|uniref:Nucleotide-binding alpha-beta plait domain-containing protein n=1 Tax=Artemisia annua TaxID=35608 RepID=A0A2U1KGN6_ARTAN|nr:nucleotide-binding alpha-beta plait domain-containing protein [Artemisia annua]
MAATEQKTETDVPPTNAPKSTDNVSEVPVTAAEPKSETDVPPTSTVNASEVPVSTAEPKTETDVPLANSPKSTANVSEVPVSATEPKTETDASPAGSPKSTVNVSEIKTVEVSNISMDVKDKDIREFFSFSGPIHYIEMKSESESVKHAFVTYKDSQGAETAALLTGATIGALSVSVSPVENYKLPPEAPPLNLGPESPGTIKKREVAQKAEEVVSTMLAKGFVLGKDALNRAKSFDERHQLSTNASATVASLDRKMGLTQKLSTGTAVVNEKMKVVNERYQVTEKSKSAIAVAEKKANSASSALMSNPYLSRGAVWLSGAFAAVAKAAEGVGSKTKQKVELSEEGKESSKTKENVEKSDDEKDESKTNDKVHEAGENEGSKTKDKVQEAEEEKEGLKTQEKVQETDEKEAQNKEKTNAVNDQAQIQVDESSKKDSPEIPPVTSSNDNNNPKQ